MTKGFRKLIAHPLCLVLFFSLPVYAQPSLVQIKTSGDFLWGEGNAVALVDARELARMDLVNRIVVTIVAEQKLVEREVDNAYTSEFRSESLSLSRLELRNLSYHEEQRRDRSWRVTAYLSRKEFEASTATNEERIMAKIRQARITEQQSNLSRALPLYTEAFLSTFFHPMPLYTDSELFGLRTLLRSHVQQKITDWMRSLTLELISIDDRSEADRTELYLNIRVSDGTYPVDFISLSINRPGYAAHPVTEGLSRIYLDRPFDSRKGQINLEIAVLPGVLHDSGLQQLLGSTGLNVLRNLSVDFSNVLRIDFEARPSGQQQVALHPISRNLAVFDITWDAGSLGRFSQTNPRINLLELNGPHPISLHLNQDSDLIVRKLLYPDGRLEPAPEATTKPVPLPHNDSISASLHQDSLSSISYSEQKPPSSALEEIPSGQRAHLQALIPIRNAQLLNDRLLILANRNILTYGNRSAVREPDSSFVIIVDPTSFEVLYFLAPSQNNRRTDLRTNESVENDLRRLFEGKGSIWIHFH